MALDAASFHNIVLESKAGQLEASAYALTAVKQLNDCFETGILSDIEMPDYDPSAICGKVFKSQRKAQAHWLRSVTNGPLDFASRMSADVKSFVTDDMAVAARMSLNSASSSLSRRGSRDEGKKKRDSRMSNDSARSIVPAIPETETMNLQIEGTYSPIQVSRVGSKQSARSASSAGSFSTVSS